MASNEFRGAQIKSLYFSTDLKTDGASGSGGGGSNGFVEPKKARALYDFEAAEDNELTFKTGEIGTTPQKFHDFQFVQKVTFPSLPVIINDDSDANWWKGSNHRGEGLFPANFVTTDLSDKGSEEKEKRRRSVQFSEEVEVKTLEQSSEAAAAFLGPVEIDEAKIDRVFAMLNDSDPTTDENDPPEMNGLEEQANAMTPLIDNELEKVDRRLAQLTRLSTELVDALNLYHQLMRDSAMTMPPGMQQYMSPQQQPYMQPPAYTPPQTMYAQQQATVPPVTTSGVPISTATGVQQQQQMWANPAMPPSDQMQPQSFAPQTHGSVPGQQVHFECASLIF